MKINKRLLSILFALLLSFQLLNNNVINSMAEIDKFIVSTVTINETEYPCYKYTGSNLNQSLEFYWANDGKVYHQAASKMLMLMLNKKYGLVVSDTWFTNFFSYWTTWLWGGSQEALSIFTGNIYRVTNNMGQVVGIALNDLTNLPLVDLNTQPNTDQTVTIPSDFVNKNKDVIDDYLQQHPLNPDFVNLPCASVDYALNNISGNYYYSNIESKLSSLTSEYVFGLAWIGDGQNHGNVAYNTFGDWMWNGLFYNQKCNSLIFETPSSIDSFCQAYNLSQSDNQLDLSEYIISDVQYGFNFYLNSVDGRIQSGDSDTKTWSVTTNAENSVSYDSCTAYSGSTSYPYYKFLPISVSQSHITAFRSAQIPTQIANNTYSQSVYVSTTWNNYNSSDDNSVTTNNLEISNSTSTNQNIYQNTQTETNTNIENNNYTYNQETNYNTTTNIINIYYPDNSGGGGDDPDDPDDDDDTIWKALLKAIAGFFEKIGELIATLLTGIFSIFTSILDAITSITEDFTSITSFISSFFSWLPTPITSLIVLGLGLALICAFLTWFKK